LILGSIRAAYLNFLLRMFAPYSYIVAALLVAILFALLFWLVCLVFNWLYVRGEPRRQERLNRNALFKSCEILDRIPVLTLWEAACWWNEERPPGEQFRQLEGDAMLQLRALIHAGGEGELGPDAQKAILAQGGNQSGRVAVPRFVLVAFAEKIGQRPLFLHPDERRL
jgi:hypothetical protein